MRVVFVGTGEIGVPSYEALADSRHEVVGVVTQPDRPAGRGLELAPSAVKRVARARGHALFQPEKINQPDVLDALRTLEPDVLVVCAYGQILREAVLALPRRACLNLHASLLPRHRGASCIQAAIRAGDAETGMTLMWMDRGLDTGDLLLAEATPIGARETAGELHDRLAALAPGLLLRGLDLLEAGQAPKVPQDHDRVTYAPKLEREQGRIDWALPAVEIDRHIRAMTPWPAAHTQTGVETGAKVLKVFGALPVEGVAGAPGEIVRIEASGVVVAAGVGGVQLLELQVAGRARMAAADCARGLRLEPGMRLG